MNEEYNSEFSFGDPAGNNAGSSEPSAAPFSEPSAVEQSAAADAAPFAESEPCADNVSYRYCGSGNPSFFREDVYAPLEGARPAASAGAETPASGAAQQERPSAQYQPEPSKSEQRRAERRAARDKRRAARDKRRARARERHLWRSVGMIAAVLVLALGGAYLGTVLATERIVDQAMAQISENIEKQGTAVLYKSVSSDLSKGASSEINVAAVAAAVQDSVVEISTEVVSYYNDWFGRIGQEVSEGAGSGVILSADGYIVTCHHVIENATSITVGLHDGETYDAVLVGSDEANDLAVLKIDADGLTPAVLGDSDQLNVGSPVVVVGNPLGSLGGTVTTGYISALERELTIEGETYNVMQTDAAINGGNSGGGLFNANGELVGVVNAKASSVGVEGLGFALPIDNLKDSIEDIISFGYTDGHATLGIVSVTINDQRTAAGYNVREYGVYIVYVVEGSNAELGGLQVGDRVVSIDGNEIEDDDQISEIMSGKKNGDTLEVEIVRDGQKRTLEVKLFDSPGEKQAS